MDPQANHSNLLYLYDLPKQETDSKKIAMAFEERAQVILETRPQIRKDIARPFYSAIVKITDPVQFNKAVEAMRYFEIGNKMCRALQFDRQLLGSNKEKLLNHNVFVRSIPKNMTHVDLHKKFEQVGKIKSLKVSFNPDHSSRGYGFICFQDEQSAIDAVKKTGNDPEMTAIKFEAKDRRSFRKLINNVYVKNIPLNLEDSKVKEMFEAYGAIKSCVLMSNDIGKYGFVCFDDPKGANKEYGPECAQKAIEGLNGKDMGNEMKLYVRHAMKKTERDAEKKKETLRYKTSKKRCNLYVKNFPNSWPKEQLENIFKQFGEIENIKLEKGKNGSFAFVCFKQPDQAAHAKATLNNYNYEGKSLMINHYEIKELRDIQIHDAIDKADFEKYQQQKTGKFHQNDWTNQPHMTQILQQLLDIMQQNQQMSNHFNQDRNMMRGQGGRRPQNYNNPRGPQNYQQPKPQQMGNMPMPPQMATGMPKPQAQFMNMPQPAQPMPQPQAQMPQPVGGNNQNQQIAFAYLQQTSQYVASVTERNPYYKEKVGEIIYGYIKSLVGDERAPKITGMLIELPVDQIRQYMQNYEALVCKVKEANDLIDQNEKASKQ